MKALRFLFVFMRHKVHKFAVMMQRLVVVRHASGFVGPVQLGSLPDHAVEFSNDGRWMS